MSLVSMLRDRIERRLDLGKSMIRHDDLATLLDIVEAKAATEPVDWHGERVCLDCRANIGDGDEHAPNCPYRRACEACGKEDETG